MNIILRNGGPPIYEQIAAQIKGQILSGALAPGTLLPSIRALAKDLKISVITTKRAYEELERQGFLTTLPGKGCFVAEIEGDILREEHLRRIEGHLLEALRLADGCGLSLLELVDLLRLLAGEERGGKDERH